MLIIYSKFGKFRNLPYICIIKVKQVVTIKKYKIMENEKFDYIVVFENSLKQRTAKVFYGTIDEVYAVAKRYKPIMGFIRSISIA